MLSVIFLAFMLFQCMSGDPVNYFLTDKTPHNWSEKMELDKEYLTQSTLIHSNLPIFYVGIQTGAYPDTLYRVLRKDQRTMLENLIARYGNWNHISVYHQDLLSLEKAAFLMAQDSATTDQNRLKSVVNQLLIQDNNANIAFQCSQLQALESTNIQWPKSVLLLTQKVIQDWESVKQNPSLSNHFWPKINFYGFQNQFHHYITSICKGDFGISYINVRDSVSSKLLKALPWTLFMSISSLFLIYLLSIPLGVWSAKYQGKWQDKLILFFTLSINSVPLFWLGTLAILFLSTTRYGLGWFVGTNTSDSIVPNDAWWQQMIQGAAHLVLPICCMVVHGLAYVVRQTRNTTLATLKEDYIRTANAKGLSSKAILWEHAFRNSLFPIISTFIAALPGLFAGSLILENVFNIPGMGKLLGDSVLKQDIPTVMGILVVGTFWVLIGSTLGEMLYRWADPRIQ
jgi:peptide/nickel transport system permease protein